MDAITVGQRIRKLRTRQGLSLATLATLSGLTKGYLSRVENGSRNLDSRRSLAVVADALHVSVAELTGQPYDPRTRHEEVVRVALADVSDTLQGTAIGEREHEPSRDLQTLRRVTGQVLQLSSDGQFATLAPLLPDLLSDLHGHVADPDDLVRHEALPSLLLALSEAQWLAKCAGDLDLAWLLAERAATAAAEGDDPVLVGFAEFARAHALTRAGKRARLRGGALAARAADSLQPVAGGSGPAAEVYGSLHAAAAWALTVNGQAAEADAHMAEADETARRTGNGEAFRLWFGPNELAIMRIATAVERCEGARVGELARGVVPESMPSRGRRADFAIQLGRGFAQESATRARAVEMFRRAERLAPLRTRMDPFVRQTVQELLYLAGGADLRQFAHRMGLINSS